MAMSIRRFLAAVLIAAAPVMAAADEVQLAVAANFAAPAKHLAERFAQGSGGHKVLISTGSTGKFYAQIKNGAPFDVLLSADAETPSRMEKEGLVVPGQRFTYALGKLVLWSPQANLVDERGEVLRKQAFRRLSIANPRLAPYGAAAQQVMEKLGVWSGLQERLVLGENIAQAYQFVSSGNAELGFVAYSQIRDPDRATTGSFWLVPQTLYAPIQQDAALLIRAEGNQAARQFLAFLRSAPARELILAYGYDLP
jgi:molybdate transport system substrate-binding protein